MALYYDLGPILIKHVENQHEVRQKLIAFYDESKSRLKKIKKGIENKKYSKVRKHIVVLKPSLEFLGMHLAVEEAQFIESWTQDQGKTKEIKEVFKSLKKRIKCARVELKKDFELKN